MRVLSRFLIREMRRYLRDSVIDELIGVKAYELRKAYRRVNGRPVEHENGGAKLVHGSGWIVLLRAV